MKIKAKYIGTVLNSTVFICNIVALILLLLSAFSDRISPNSFMVFAYLGLGFPFILFINIIFLLWWIILWKWKYLLVCLAGLIISSGAIFTYFPLHKKTKEIPSDCIKVLTYNTMRFNQYKRHTKNKPNEIIQFIHDSGADIVCIQEFGIAKIDGLLSEKDIEKALKDKYPYRKYVKTLDEGKYGKCGNALFSKFPISNFKKIPYKSEYNGSFAVTLDIKGKKVLLVNNHLESNKLSQEDRSKYVDALKEIKGFEFKNVEDVSETVRGKFSTSYRNRAHQADVVWETIKNSDIPYKIVCGDFNDTPISYARHQIMGDELKDAYAETGFGPGISYNQNGFWFRIDYILHSENIKAYNCEVGKLKFSDHYPVWTYLQLK